MHMSILNATAAALVAGATLAAQAADTGFVSARTDTGGQIYTLKKETSAAYDSWTDTGIGGRVDASMSASGYVKSFATAWVSAVTVLPSTNNGGPRWLDVLYISVPGALPGTRTRINFSMLSTGTVQRDFSHDTDWISSYSGLLCLGQSGTNGCGHYVPAWVTHANLPAPSGVYKGTTLTYDVALDSTTLQLDFNKRVSGYIVVQGPSAVVPLVGYAIASTRSTNPVGATTASGTSTFHITLPAGVTCTSRSGLAFNSACPLAQ